METREPIRFYWSFRSPYAWLAAERLESELGDLPLPVEPIPVYPRPGLFPNDPTAVPNKIRFLVQDVRRLAAERGLAVVFPPAGDPDWAPSHAAFLGAQARGAGVPFMLQLFHARFCEGLDLGRDDVIADAAERAGIDRASILESAHSPELQARVADNFRRGIEEDRIFGVPSFVYGRELFWGQDRMHHLRAAVLA